MTARSCEIHRVTRFRHFRTLCKGPIVMMLVTPNPVVHVARVSAASMRCCPASARYRIFKDSGVSANGRRPKLLRPDTPKWVDVRSQETSNDWVVNSGHCHFGTFSRGAHGPGGLRRLSGSSIWPWMPCPSARPRLYFGFSWPFWGFYLAAAGIHCVAASVLRALSASILRSRQRLSLSAGWTHSVRHPDAMLLKT